MGRTALQLWLLVHVQSSPRANYRAYLGTFPAPCVPGPMLGNMELPRALKSRPCLTLLQVWGQTQPALGLPGQSIHRHCQFCGWPHAGHLSGSHQSLKPDSVRAAPDWHGGACLGEPKGTLPPGSFPRPSPRSGGRE